MLRGCDVSSSFIIYHKIGSMRYTNYKKTSAVVRRDEKKMLSAVKVLDGRRAQLLQDRTVKKLYKIQINANCGSVTVKKRKKSCVQK